jgi:hypothetical protein
MSGRKIPNFELKSAIKALSGFNYKIGDSFKLDEPYPYIIMGDVFGGAWDSKESPGGEVTIRFHCWSNEDSEEQVSDMMENVCDAVGLSNDATRDHLTLTNYNVVGQFQDSQDSIRDKDDKGPLRHGIIDIRFVLQQK